MTAKREANKTQASSVVALDAVPAHKPLAVALAQTPEDLAQMASDIGAVSIGKFRFEGQIEQVSGTEFLLTGTIGATVTQSCVVTLAPVRTRVDEPVRRRFTTLDQTEAAEYQLLEDEDVDVDPLRDEIDLGEIAREALILALPAYPRAQGAELRDASARPPGAEPLTEAATRPFAALSALKAKMEGKDT